MNYTDIAKQSPQCFGCGDPNDGTCVLAHRNRGGWGLLFGRGIKSRPRQRPLMRTVTRMQVTRKGRRYWSVGPVVFTIRTEPHVRRYKWTFWSDHKWPFYHGSVTLLANDPEAASRAFIRWLPFGGSIE